MKAFLGAMVFLAFAASQSYAIPGGPFSGSRIITTGTYAGVLVPSSKGEDSLALFSLKIPPTGVGTGSVIVFRNGVTYIGTVNGVADPKSNQLSGIFNATYTVVSSTTTTSSGSSQSNTAEYHASGALKDTYLTNSRNVGFISSVRIIGTGSLTYKLISGSSFSDLSANAGPIDYKVVGFKQSESSS